MLKEGGCQPQMPDKILVIRMMRKVQTREPPNQARSPQKPHSTPWQVLLEELGQP